MAGQLVQSATDQGQKSLATLVLPAAVAAGNCLILTVVVNNGDLLNTSFGTPTGIAVGGGGWQQITNGPRNNPYVMTWWALPTTGGGTTVTVTVGGTVQEMTAILSEFSGITSVLAQPDAQQSNTGNSGTPFAGVTTVTNNDLAYAVVATRNSDTRISGPTNGFTQIAFLTTTAASQPSFNLAMGVGWRNTTLAGTYTTTWSTTTGGWTPVGHTLALKLQGDPAALVALDAGTSGDAAMLSASSNIVVPAAVFNVPDRYLFDGFDLSTFAVTQTRTQGADNHPALRGENPPWAGIPGSQSLEQLPGSRIVSLDMFVHGMNANGTVGAAMRTQARTNLDALQAVLARGGNRPLIRVMPDGTGRQAYARVWNVQEIDGRLNNALFALKVDFYLADPYFYTNTSITGPTSLSSGSVLFSLGHSGTVRGHHILFDIAGPVTDPRITNLTTGTWVQFTGSVPSGQRLYIDSEHFSAFLAGTNVVGSITHDGGVPFMWLVPGSNSMQVTSTAFGGTLTTTFAPPFI